MNLKSFAVLAVLLFISSAALAETADDIVALAKKGENEEKLLAVVQNSKTSFDLSAAQILKLKEANVPDSVVLAMVKHAGVVRQEAVQPLPVSKAEGRADGSLAIENLDDKPWHYMYEPAVRTIWISRSGKDNAGIVHSHNGVTIRLPAGPYKIRYNRRENSESVTVFGGEKSTVMLSRVEAEGAESLYVSIFEHGERKAGSRLAVLRDSAQAGDAAKLNDEIAPERVVQAPPPAVIYQQPQVIYSVPVYDYGYASPYYYSPSYYCGPRYPSFFGFGFSHFGHHSSFRGGVGVGF